MLSNSFLLLLMVLVMLVMLMSSSGEQVTSKIQKKIQRRRSVRIVGGHDALPGEIPWHVAHRINASGNSNGVDSCGGAIIHERWILTAAHCAMIFKHVDMTLVYGTNEQLPGYGHGILKGTGKVDEINGLIAEVDTVIVHPDYNYFTVPGLEYDIALYHTSEPMKLGTPMAQAIKLAGTSPETSTPLMIDPPPGTRGFKIAGFGQTNRPSPPSRLQVLETEPVISRVECAKPYHVPALPEGVMCTGNTEEGHAPCEGDSGGALVRKLAETDDKHGATPTASSVLVAVNSFTVEGNDCKGVGSPTGYVLIAKHIPWIRSLRVPI